MHVCVFRNKLKKKAVAAAEVGAVCVCDYKSGADRSGLCPDPLSEKHLAYDKILCTIYHPAHPQEDQKPK